MITTSRIPEVHHPHMCTTRIHQHRPHPRTVVNVLVYSDNGVQYYYCHFYLFIISLYVHDHAMEVVSQITDCLLVIHLLPASK